MYQNKRNETRKKIVASFMELVSKNGIKEVTVKQIAENANVSRGTFYQHYYDKYVIFDDQKNMLFKQITLQQNAFLLKNETDLRQDLLDGKFVSKILDIFKENAGVVSFLFNYDERFRTQTSDFFEQINQKTLRKINPLVTAKRIKVIAAVIATVLIKFIELYILSPDKYDKDFILRESRELIRVNVLSIL
ncbi:Nucleoid occlusion factor SlmA [Apilactobacillus kunkeei]|nr:Nucleoid occlusion factor SlmA [Apilactobacillus kunkeei]CAI2549906.1 Nucleoid occlusion factor SlmA [Apilactobacillus kunkeei]CAI2800927.1 Nucleoid occlusion factor SlmA [Apilactobacillus kunkeei]